MADPSTQAAWLALLILTLLGTGGLGDSGYGQTCDSRLATCDCRSPLVPVPPSPLLARVVPHEPFGHTTRLRFAFALDGHAPGDLQAAADLLERADRHTRADARAGRDRGDEAHTDEPVVDRH